MFQSQAEHLRKMAVVACIAQIIAAAALPCTLYYFVYQKDVTGIAPQAWVTLGIIVAIGIMGVLAHATSSTALTVVHLILGATLSTALGAWCTAWWWVLDTACHTVQAASVGCDQCACALTNSCTTEDLKLGECDSCEAIGSDICEALGEVYTKYMLAVTGAVIVLSMCIPLCIDVRILLLDAAFVSSIDARKQVLKVAIETQTRLLVAGDKPTVTPGTLTDWVSTLLSLGGKESTACAERCREALRERGYELPVHRNRSMRSTSLRKRYAGSDAGNSDSPGQSPSPSPSHHTNTMIKHTLSNVITSGAGTDPDAEQDALERGSYPVEILEMKKAKRPRRVTPEPILKPGGGGNDGGGGGGG